jgi:hypothetical protein
MAVVSAHNTHELFTESVTSNASLQWDRFNSSGDCFESEADILEPVKIVDVLDTGAVRPYQITTEETLNAWKKSSSSFKLRLMHDVLTFKGLR